MGIALDKLKEFWGYDNFRPLQDEIVESVLSGEDSLVLMPTGGGKSLCYQVPALCLEGLTLVISPLIALMKDQVDNLKKRNISAEAIYSGMAYQQIDRILDNAVHGAYKMLYLSPERLKSEIFVHRLPKMNVNLIAVDEAHCVSQWGFDFRPAYLEIASLRQQKPDVPMIALTATATSEVIEDIQLNLELKTKRIFQKSFERENLAYIVIKQEGKLEKLADIISKVSGSTIVYCPRRGATNDIATFLNRRSISCAAYHAGMSPQDRMDIQAKWMRGDIRVIAATNAFGMGIDKSDVRLVIHTTMPSSLEAYYQEAGRAGRDGKKSFGILLYDYHDKETLTLLLDQKYPSLKVIRQVYQGLSNAYQLAIGSNRFEPYDFDLIKFCKTYKFSPGITHYALGILQKEGWINISDAVFQPSKLWVKVSKERLYDFQLKNKTLEPILKTILRTYQGAFQQLVNINEFQLSKFLNLTGEQLKKAFLFMQQQGVIDYRPKKDKPQITFLMERIAAGNLTIDSNRYKFLKQRAEFKLKKMFQYAEDPVCRSIQLLQYFGENKGNSCGQCDVCLDRKKVDFDNLDFYKIRQKIERILKKQNGLTFDEIVGHFSHSEMKRMIWVLAYLRDENLIKYKSDRFTINKSNAK